MAKKKEEAADSVTVVASHRYEDVYDLNVTKANKAFVLQGRESSLKKELARIKSALELDTGNESAGRMVISIERKLAAIDAAKTNNG